MAHVPFEASSRRDWGLDEAHNPSIFQLGLGCLQRIATSLETIAQDRERLVAARDEVQRRLQCAERREQHLIETYSREKRRTAALRGLVKRLKSSQKS
jgi:hypothetical protein